NKDSLGPVKQKVKGDVLNKVNNTSDQVKQVQEGFKMAYNEKEGTGYQSFNDTVVPSAGKTGTAEVFQDGKLKVNSTYVGDAPISNSKLSFSNVYTYKPRPEPWVNSGD